MRASSQARHNPNNAARHRPRAAFGWTPIWRGVFVAQGAMDIMGAADDFANELLTVDCPSCGQEVSEREGRLKNNPQVACPGCGELFDFNKISSALSEFYKRIDKFPGQP
ncbi:MAG: YnfU family zinc-binding protein [Candidatus Saccharimonadales bacterium]